MRRVVAFAILPFLAAALAYVGAPLFERSLLKQVGGSFNDSFAAPFAFSTFFVAVIVITFGAVPLFSWLSERRAIRYRDCLVAGIALGNAPFLIACALLVVVRAVNGTPQSAGNAWYGFTGILRTLTTGTVIGAALGSVFWFVGIRGTDAPTN